MDCSMPGFPVHHQLSEFAQTHVPWVADAIQPSHPLSPPSPLALNLSQHQSLFQWVSPSYQVAKVRQLQLSPSNEYSGLISFRIDWFDLLTLQGSLKIQLLENPTIHLWQGRNEKGKWYHYIMKITFILWTTYRVLGTCRDPGSYFENCGSRVFCPFTPVPNPEPWIAHAVAQPHSSGLVSRSQ